MRVLSRSDLTETNFAHELVGDDHGGVGVSLILVEAPPGRGPSLHTHPYAEVFVVHDGEGTFVAGDEERVVRGGEIVIVPPETPHGFTNTGEAPLRMTNVHVNSRFVTEWL
jgi:mannose-6-phosphate isomerase-like protein (cupin superfamily)